MSRPPKRKDGVEDENTAPSGSGLAGVAPTFILAEYRDPPAYKSLAEIEKTLTNDLMAGIFPRGLIPHITNLLVNMKSRGISWANAHYDATYLTSETPEEVRAAILKKLDESDQIRPAGFSRGRGGFRGNRGNNRGGRGRGKGGQADA